MAFDMYSPSFMVVDRLGERHDVTGADSRRQHGSGEAGGSAYIRSP
jgi:hypothetical protein